MYYIWIEKETWSWYNVLEVGFYELFALPESL
jgi:hypothetical protein